MRLSGGVDGGTSAGGQVNDDVVTVMPHRLRVRGVIAGKRLNATDIR